MQQPRTFPDKNVSDFAVDAIVFDLQNTSSPRVARIPKHRPFCVECALSEPTVRWRSLHVIAQPNMNPQPGSVTNFLPFVQILSGYYAIVIGEASRMRSLGRNSEFDEVRAAA